MLQHLNISEKKAGKESRKTRQEKRVRLREGFTEGQERTDVELSVQEWLTIMSQHQVV